MAESQSEYDADQYENELDQGMASVMPSTWLGHGRIMIHERGFNDRKKTFAERLMRRLSKKYPDQPTEKLAEKAADMADEKLDG